MLGGNDPSALARAGSIQNGIVDAQGMKPCLIDESHDSRDGPGESAKAREATPPPAGEQEFMPKWGFSFEQSIAGARTNVVEFTETGYWALLSRSRLEFSPRIGRSVMRAAFILTVREGKEAAYREAHQAVWPELIAAANRAGIRNHSCFMNGRTVVAYLEGDNIEKSSAQLANDPVKIRWNEYMEEFLEPGAIPLEEVFHME